jgi:ATPase family associated with various cellular activities (AAA)
MDNTISNDSFVNGNGKVHFSDVIRVSVKPMLTEVNKFYFGEIIDLLLNVYEDVIVLPEIKVKRLYNMMVYGIQDLSTFRRDNGMLSTFPDKVYSEFTYNDVSYFAMFYKEKDNDNKIHYYASFNYDESAKPQVTLINSLLELALSHTSKYKTGCVEISYNGQVELISNLNISEAEVQEGNLDRIFIRNNIKECIERFIYTFENFNTFKTPLRYLLSGKPGLGKTEVIRAIIDKCSKAGNVIIPTEMRGADWLSFEFGKLFKPSLICIDDIDLALGDRDKGFNRKALGSFLRALDGITKNDVFVIATTNDKNLVDIAASRPGRFDEIIDFGEFESKYYLDLIKNHTDDERIVTLFDDM